MLFLSATVFAALLQGVQSRAVPDFSPPPDFRPGGCVEVDKAPTTKVSIIIPSLNEDFNHVMKTFLAIKEYTPMELLEEIIWINDGGECYEEEMKSIIPQTVVIRHSERQGLIRSKTKGAKMAKAPIILFYEPHVVASKDWFVPLVRHIELNPTAVAMPSLDVWNFDGTFAKAAIGYYRFEWNFNLMYTNAASISSEDPAPYPTPATAGGIFAMRKDFFEQLELYDEDLNEWGGDHIELAFKVWRCGGRIDMFPCSRVSHLFRSEEKRPYDVDVSKVVQNYVRLARVWLDQKFLSVFYKVKPESKKMTSGDLNPQKNLKTKLKCKSMSWYLKNIDWEMGWEASHVCIPGASAEHGGCELPTTPSGRTTIDRTMPQKEFLKAQLESDGLFLEPDEPHASDEL